MTNLSPSPIILFIGLLLIYAVVAFMVFIGFDIAFGQEPDYRYACSFANQFPFNEICQKQINLVKLLLITHIMQCASDEVICVTGHPDPDFDDDGSEK